MFLRTQFEKICNEGSDNDFIFSKKNKVKTTVQNANLDSFWFDIIIRTIKNFYIVEKKVPTIPKLLFNFQEEKKHSVKYCMKLDSDGKTAETHGS